MNWLFGSKKPTKPEVSEEEKRQLDADHARNQRLKKLGGGPSTNADGR